MIEEMGLDRRTPLLGPIKNGGEGETLQCEDVVTLLVKVLPYEFLAVAMAT
jgi:hypothetical protein